MKIVTDKTPKVDIHAILTPQEIDGIHHHIHHYPQARAAVLDALKLVQKRNGWVNDAKWSPLPTCLASVWQMLRGWQHF